ncbi:hypothetical protein BH20ACI1_BH20ACI1_32150 [soil metagenome]
MKILTFILLPFVFLLSACRPAAAPVSVSNKPVSINNIPNTNLPMPPSKPLGEMSWTILDGGEQKLKDLQGKVVVLDFWATYCPPCLEEIPHLNQLQTKYGAEKLQIIGLNVGGDDDRPKIPAFAEKLKINYTLAIPEDALMQFVFATQSEIPQTAVFDKNGKLIQKFIGYDLTVKNRLDKAIEQALNQ